MKVQKKKITRTNSKPKIS